MGKSAGSYLTALKLMNKLTEIDRILHSIFSFICDVNYVFYFLFCRLLDRPSPMGPREVL